MILPQWGGTGGEGGREERVKIFFLLNDAVEKASLLHYRALINGVLYRVSNNYIADLYLCIIQLDTL
jgi:hypothetical protein